MKSIPTVWDPVKWLPWEILADKLPTSPLTTLRFCFDFLCAKETLSLLNTFVQCFFFFFAKCYLSLLFPEGLLSNYAGSYISRERRPKVPGLLDLPDGKRQCWALIKLHVFLTNVPGPLCTANLAQYGMQTDPTYTLGAPLQMLRARRPGTLDWPAAHLSVSLTRFMAVHLTEKIAFLRLSSQT